jgi:hypothetical protein
MLAPHRCTFVLPEGRPCRAIPQRDVPFCFFHAPGSEEEAAEARRLGGLRRRREKTLYGAYDFAGLGSVESIRRILEIATLDALGLDNSIARARVLIAAALAAARLLEVGELEARVEALEAALAGARQPAPPLLVTDGGGLLGEVAS